MFFFYLKTVTTEKGAVRNLVEVSSERKGSIGLFQDCNYVYINIVHWVVSRLQLCIYINIVLSNSQYLLLNLIQQ